MGDRDKVNGGSYSFFSFTDHPNLGSGGKTVEATTDECGHSNMGEVQVVNEKQVIVENSGGNKYYIMPQLYNKLKNSYQYVTGAEEPTGG